MYASDLQKEYVLVMIQNKKTKPQIATDLEAFLGKQAKAFADWYKFRVSLH